MEKLKNDYKKVTVIGGGVIGYSWAIVFSRKGIPVTIYNRKSPTYDSIMPRITEGLNFLKNEGVIDCEIMKNALSIITVTDNLEEALKNTDYVQECLWEDLNLKQGTFVKLTDILPSNVPIGSSCSGLRITDIAKKVVNSPERCIVAHPTNPPHLIPFMEISGDNASSEIKESVFKFMESLGQKPILCKEVYGYVLNRIQLSLVQEALYLVQQEICSVEAVERALTDGLGLRWAFTGPFGVEELNSENLKDGLTKYKDYMIEFFTNQQEKVLDYDQDFVNKLVDEFKPIMKGKSHEEYLKWRNTMVTRTRILKESD